MKRFILFLTSIFLFTGCSNDTDPVIVEETKELKVVEIGMKEGAEVVVVRFNNELRTVKLQTPSQKGEYITVNVLSNHTLEPVE